MKNNTTKNTSNTIYKDYCIYTLEDLIEFTIINKTNLTKLEKENEKLNRENKRLKKEIKKYDELGLCDVVVGMEQVAVVKEFLDELQLLGQKYGEKLNGKQ